MLIIYNEKRQKEKKKQSLLSVSNKNQLAYLNLKYTRIFILHFHTLK